MATYPDRADATQYAPPPRVVVDRLRSTDRSVVRIFSALGRGRGDRGSTFRDCLPRIEDAKAMGFDVIYFPPIHPIGHTNRKGRNNSITSEAGEPGVPCGDRQRSMADTRRSIPRSAHWKILTGWKRRRANAEWKLPSISPSIVRPIILTSTSIPDWFYKRPDGTIKYAENPPKKYEDIYPLNFRCENWRELWAEMKSIILFWAERGVRIFRVDNPHTKPVRSGSI